MVLQEYSTLESLSAEAARLQVLIRESEERLHEVRTLIRLAKEFNLATSPAPEPISSILASRMARLAGLKANPASLKSRIIEACEHILSDGERRLSRELLPELARRGVILEGSDPAANLSAYLSKERDRFTSNQKLGGWTLTRLTQRSNNAPSAVVAGTVKAGGNSESPTAEG